MLPDGVHSGSIIKASVWSNPSGPDKLIVEFELVSGEIFSHFFTPGFPAFDDLLKLAGEPVLGKGSLDEQKLVGKGVTFETLINAAKNGNEYCNVQWVKPGPGVANPNATVEEREAEMNPFADKKKA